MFKRKGFFLLSFLLLLVLGARSLPADAQGGVLTARIKDLARLEEDRANQLTGFGLVVGLNGTGDNQGYAVEMVQNFLAHHGYVPSDPRINIRVRNAAAVALSATLPPYRRSGDTIEVTVSSLGDAKSLQGGVLLQSPLAGADGKIYAVAQGPVVVSGVTATGRSNRQTANQPTVALVQAIVEREVSVEREEIDVLRWVLFDPDFSTASMMAQAINSYWGEEIAHPENKADVRVEIPEAYRHNPVEFIAAIETIPITRDQAAKVVVNPRAGTIVFDENVRIAPVAVTRGNITVNISPRPADSQPQEAQTVSEEEGPLVALSAGTTLEEMVRALNAVGATPQEIINIIIAIDQAGALYGALEIR
ncbi:MAG: flagellar basal body P-ring protein FlgI [Firmicutes bacterium]|nr:flagellar basal body P-ring protein FlgI [Bacillota bacterium]